LAEADTETLEYIPNLEAGIFAMGILTKLVVVVLAGGTLDGPEWMDRIL